MTLTQNLIPLSDKLAWDQALNRVPDHQYAHMHWYNHAMHIASDRVIFLYHAYAEGFAVVCPISPRRKSEHDPLEVTTPYGFSGFAVQGCHENFAAVWHRFMSDHGYVCGHIALHPFHHEKYLYAANEIDQGKNTYFIDLTQSVADIYQGFSTDHRHRLRQWEKAGYQVVCEKNPAVISAFIEMYGQSLAARNAAKIYDFGDEAWREIIAAPESFLFSVTVNGVIEAAALFIAHNHIADYFMMSSTDNGRIHARGVIMAAVKFFKESNINWMHLGCGVKENDALEQFKARFGGKPYPTYALKQVYNADVYQTVCRRYEIDPSEREGYFPGYWASAVT